MIDFISVYFCRSVTSKSRREIFDIIKPRICLLSFLSFATLFHSFDFILFCMKTIKVSSILFIPFLYVLFFPKFLFCFVLFMPIEMSPLPFLLLLSLCWLRPQAFETTICDCSEPLRMGILQFSDTNCRPKENDKNNVLVKYGVYSEERAAVHFPGYICAKWKNIKNITMSFFGQVVIVPDKISIDRTPSECNDMINHKKCNGN